MQLFPCRDSDGFWVIWPDQHFYDWPLADGDLFDRDTPEFQDYIAGVAQSISNGTPIPERVMRKRLFAMIDRCMSYIT